MAAALPAEAPLMRKFAYADALADRVAGQAYRALEPPERRELAELLTAAIATASDR
jgi:hypothetical protein